MILPNQTYSLCTLVNLGPTPRIAGKHLAHEMEILASFTVRKAQLECFLSVAFMINIQESTSQGFVAIIGGGTTKNVSLARKT